MKLSEILGLDVLDPAGERIGTAEDLRLIQDGPLRGPYVAALRVSGVIVVEHRHYRLLGYERDVGPWIFKHIARRVTGDVTFIAWNDITGIDEAGIHVRTARRETRNLTDLPDRHAAGAALEE